jgi:hypothetical protein
MLRDVPSTEPKSFDELLETGERCDGVIGQLTT